MKTLSVILAVIFCWLCLYLGLPTLSFGFVGWSFILFFLGVILFVMNLSDNFERTNSLSKVGLVFAIVAAVFIIILPIFTTWSLFRASAYQKLIGEVEMKQVTTDISPTSLENIVIIDAETAHRLGDKKLVDEDHALGSQVVVDHFTLQKVGDKLYYVAPLLHTGFFKWNENSQGTPGYIIVNATNEKDVRLVKSDKQNNPIHLKYQMNGYFSDYLPRHIYFNGYMTKGFTDYSFEIDDDYKPWYVVTLYDKEVGYSGNNATGILLIDPANGKIFQFNLNEVPEWVDRVQPVDFIDDQLNNWGKLIHGWWNPSDQDKLQLSQGNTLVYGEDGKCYFYSGVSSVGEDGSSVGFFLVDTRTKKATFYKSSGAVEYASMRSAEGAVQEKAYKATFPRPYNINGVFTYVMALKDAEGLIKSVALVSYENYQIVGIGDDLRDALRNYKSKLNSTGNRIATDASVTRNKIKDIIWRISSDDKNGNTYYYIMLRDHKDKIFVSTSSISEELPLSKFEDTVIITYSDSEDGIIDIQSYDNVNINVTISKPQVAVEKYFEKVDSVSIIKKDAQDADVLFDKLSNEEKAKMLKDIKKQ